MPDTPDLALDLTDHVATVEIRRPPHNFFDYSLVQQLAETFEAMDADPACRAILLCSEGKNFCAGANFGDGRAIDADGSVEGAPNREGVQHLYVEAVRLFRTTKPIVAAIQGAAIGGGLGLAMVADFRVGCPESRFAANFTRLGFHPGFGLTVTLPRVIGPQRAALMFLTSRRIRGDDDHAWGLLDAFTTLENLRDEARALAREIAANAPLGTVSTRATLRAGLADAVRAATDHELSEQTRLRRTEDFREGVAASAERRDPAFKGR